MEILLLLNTPCSEHCSELVLDLILGLDVRQLVPWLLRWCGWRVRQLVCSRAVRSAFGGSAALVVVAALLRGSAIFTP